MRICSVWCLVAAEAELTYPEMSPMGTRGPQRTGLYQPGILKVMGTFGVKRLRTTSDAIMLAIRITSSPLLT